MNFRLAPMSPLIRALTVVLLLIPAVFFLTSTRGANLLGAIGLILVALYVWIWLRFRPTRFVIHPHTLEVIWPLKRREVPREEIADVRLISKEQLKREVGWGTRVGVGGMWGGFGWLWTQKRGIVQMYISRTDGLVWIERMYGRPWLITPEAPQDFVQALADGRRRPHTQARTPVR
jgi:hypothetical protein